MTDNSFNGDVKVIVDAILDDYKKGRTIDDSKNYVESQGMAINTRGYNRHNYPNRQEQSATRPF